MEFDDLIDEFDGETPSSSLYPSIPSPSAAPPAPTVTVANPWVAKMTAAGLGEKDASRYSKIFALAKIDAKAPRQMKDGDLKKIGVLNPSHRKILVLLLDSANGRKSRPVKSIGERKASTTAAEKNAKVTKNEEPSPSPAFSAKYLELKPIWYSLLVDEGFSREEASWYSSGLAENGVDENVVVQLDDDMLREGGIEDPEHRDRILFMIDRLIMEDEEEDQEEASASEPSAGQDGTDPVDWEEFQKRQQSVEQNLAQYSVFQSKLAKVLAGDTPRQRKARAARAEARRQRAMARQERRMQRLLEQTKR